ncbi:MAG: class I SAM-dependent methyltransferase [Armatimonadetes bacterium]|nr:class I SAM-dependent methyltransferase [Armatimonadota bacterium]
MPFSYSEFEHRFRGSYEDVRAEQQKYLRFFEGAPGPVIDLGCGRGEFLSLLRERGQACYGIDSSPTMLAEAQRHDVDARDEDLLAHLDGLDDGALGGIFMCQVIEHLRREDVMEFAELASRKVAAGGVVVIETLNPQCVFSYAPFTMDLTHRWPIHPQTLQFLLEAGHFGEFEYLYRQYIPDELLQLPAPLITQGPQEAQFADAMRKLQIIIDLAFKNFVYAVSARRLREPSDEA